MPLPKALARFNRRVTNRVMPRVAGWTPGFAIIEHVGRKSGRRYRTPVNAFRDGATLTFALTYGPESEWVRNVLAAGGCCAHMRRRTLTLTDPHLVHDEQRRRVPAPVRLALRAMKVDYFLELTVADEDAA